jgi:hypothetical protein
MTSWDEVKRYLAGSKDALQASTAKFAAVDAAQLAADLRLKERAAVAEPAIIGLDVVERDIVADIERRARVAHGEYNAALDVYDARLRQSAVGSEGFVLIKDAAERGLTNFRAQCEADRLPLLSADRQARKIEAEFVTFQRNNGLEEVAPSIHTSSERSLSYAIIALLLLGETVLNGVFFATGSEQGLIGGVAQALSLSAVNIALAAVLGAVAARNTHHARWLRKILGWILLVLTAVAALVVNLIIAHYREHFAAAAGQPVDFNAVWHDVRYATFGIGDLMSWVLGALGLIAFAWAARKFYALDDPYPSYGSIARRHERGLNNLAESRHACIGNLTGHRDSATEEMRSVISTISARKRDFELALNSRARLRQDYKHHIEYLTRLCSQLGQVYRQARPFPQALETRELSVELEAPAEFISSFSQNDVAVHERAIETMSHYIDQISAEFNTALKSISSITAPWEDARATPSH